MMMMVQVHIDDILIWADSAAELYEILKQVLDRLLEFGVKVNLEKCKFFVDKVVYLGHEISESGISPNKEKTRAISQAPEPQNVSQLKSFLGMIMYYSKFLEKLNVKLSPLFKLLRKDTKWEWNQECQRAFELSKKELSSDKLLVHYDPKLPIIVTCDASNDGIGGVLSHRVNGQERPVFFVSRTLTAAEKNYPILHREALAIVFTVEKFYKYVYGHRFEIFTDHKPLEGIFKCKRGEPAVIASRLQRYIIRMSIFDYSLTYKKGQENGNADCLSRLPIRDRLNEEDEREQKTFEIKALQSGGPLSLNIESVRKKTEEDSLLKEIRSCVMHGWRNGAIPRAHKNFFAKSNALSVEQGCVLFGSRLVMPKSLYESALSLLHSNHMGIVKMKQLARQYLFWDGLNEDIERYVASCETCQTLRKDKPDKVYGEWKKTTFPFERVHLDFFHFRGQTFLIFIDVFTRWLEIKRMNRTTAHHLTTALSEIFGTFGYASECVCDNGPPYNSYDFRKWLEERDIKLTHSPPYHPQSNGIVERAVQTTKGVLRKFVLDNKDSFQINRAIEEFLFTYRNTPRTENQIIPSHQMFAFQPKWKIPVLNFEKKNVRVKIEQKKRLAKPSSARKELARKAENKTPALEFKKNEEVLYLSSLKGYCYATKAKIVERLSAFVYLINVQGVMKKAHINQLRKSILKRPIYKAVEPEKKKIVEFQDAFEMLSDSQSSSSSSDEAFSTASETDRSMIKTPETPEVPRTIRKSVRKRLKTSFFRP